MYTLTFIRMPLLLLCSLLIESTAHSQIPVASKQFTGTVPGIGSASPILLSNLDEIKFTAPPAAAQQAIELTEIKKKMKQVDEKILREIRYWDAGSPAYRWNEITASLIDFTKPTFFRFPSAWINMAIYDATLVAWKEKFQYNRKRPSETDASLKPLIMVPATPSYPCEHTVTAAAAATVIGYFYPEIADSILMLARQASESRIYAGAQYPSDVAEAWKIGEAVAQKIIAKAKNDGSGTPFTGNMPTGPGVWKGPYPVGIQVTGYEPIFMERRDQFRPPAPPDFAKEMKELKEFKQDFRSNYLALRWAALTGFDIWTELAGKKIFEENLHHNTPLCASIYGLLSTAMYDASIAIMDAKYAYWGIRPNQYDSSYRPLLFTPPFPGYPSGHATASSAAATVLSYFFPADRETFRKLAQECADSRFYGGIHFRSDNEVGLRMGESLANYVIKAWEKRHGPVMK